jgi:hypothetical protein
MSELKELKDQLSEAYAEKREAAIKACAAEVNEVLKKHRCSLTGTIVYKPVQPGNAMLQPIGDILFEWHPEE